MASSSRTLKESSGAAGRSRRKVPQCIADQLAQRLGREWLPGQRLPSILELSERLGAGFISTHRAMRELAARGLLITQPGVGVRVADCPATRKPPAYRVPDRSIMTYPLAGLRVDVITANSTDALFLNVVQEFTQGLACERLDVRHESVDMSDNLLDVSRRNVLAVAVLGSFHRIQARSDQLLVAAGPSPIQVLAPASRFDMVTVDQERAGFLAGSHLAQVGLTDVCFAGVDYGRPSYANISTQRLAGLQAGLGHPIPSNWQLRVSAYDWISGARVFQQYARLKPRPSAIYVASDDLAIGFILAAQGQGLEAGQDYHIIGTDGQIQARQCSSRPLTTIEMPAQEMGQQAAKMLLSRFFDPDQAPRRLALGGRLFAGQTVGKSQSKAG